MLVFVTRALSGTNGADRVATEILASLVATGRPVAAILQEDVSRQRRTAEMSVQWVTAPAQVRFPARLGRRWPRALASWVKWSIWNIPRRLRLRRIEPGLVLVNGFGSHDFWAHLSLASSAHSALIVHESPRHFGGQQVRSLEWALEAMESYQNFIFVSERCRREWSRYPVVALRTTFAVPNCCREDEVAHVLREERDAARKRLGFGPNEFVVACVSTVQHRKGQDLLVESLPELVRRVPGLVLEIVGNTVGSPDGVVGSQDFRAELLRRVQHHQMGDRVHFRGPRGDALEFIYASNVLVLPSRAEAMPLVVLEAMALGTPVVASGVDGVTELIIDDSTGLLFDPTRPADLIEAVVRIASDPEFARALARRGQERYWRTFNAGALREGYAAVVARISAAPRSATLPSTSTPARTGRVSTSGQDSVVAANTTQDA